jgi:hypothetical protein
VPLGGSLAAVRQRARHVVARNARNADELTHFLNVLDLWPKQDDDEYPTVAPKPLDPGTISIRRIRFNRAHTPKGTTN